VSIITVGRICKQKDPQYFYDAFQAYRGDRQWVWVGGPDDLDKWAVEMTERMKDAGITVTGWLSSAGLRAWYAKAHVYVHTAAWEGNPVTIYEASAMGLPVIARDIPAVKHEGITYLTNSPAHMAGWVSVMDDEYQWRRAVWATFKWVDEKAKLSQRGALLKLYGIESTDTDSEDEPDGPHDESTTQVG